MLLNAAVAARGVSGTATALTALERALECLSVDWTRVAPPDVGRRGLRRAIDDAVWDMYRAPRAGAGDVIIHPANVGGDHRGIQSCLIVHDTMVLDFPQWYDKRYAAYARALIPLSVRRAAVVVTPSRASRASIVRRWPRAQVTVLPWPSVVPVVARPRERPRSRNVVMIAATEPRKNHWLAIDAVRMARIITGEDITLTLIGARGIVEEGVQAYAHICDPLRSWIFRRQLLRDSELVAALDDAWVAILPSSHEGYGLPLIEASARALPTLHSGAGAMAEVMPEGIVQGGAFDYALALADLLDAEQYERASRATYATAGRHAGTVFASGLKDILEGVT